jgi:hypothetical protein
MRVKNCWNKSGQTQTGMMSAHTHRVISTDRDYSILKLSEKCGCLFKNLDLAHGDFQLYGSLKKHFEGNYMSCC